MYKILANTIFLGKDVHFLPECHSTNDKAIQMIKQKVAHEGTIIICEHQTHGKGQRGNKWLSEKGLNLTFSLVLKPSFMDLSEQFYLNMAISNSIRKLFQEYIASVKVKWPNDLIVPEFGKIGGILIENTFSGDGWEFAVVGVGININQQSFESVKATSLANVTGNQFDLKELFRLLITQIEQGYLHLKRGNWSEIKKEYLHHLYLKGEWSNFKDYRGEFKGLISGVSKEGKLEVELESGDVELFGLKEIVFLNY
ncbi:MAG: biotin--[acetyl-CoA-carboxylase] ligase [Algoriphagus sp.]|uniref:biotin--[acetyl-CoA-carboxylase] ligase n=1 Tax=Algoriphagus sp. TaxID=1872435 RepID=UPI002629672E|nr:biotin--[acetyl-CoA-carboxylase] ligase [Algoriphagus sp.]MDG1277458.1 biotin--[acetyl-CoA-carboxylase] ligase [Algoriphagus sp.]